MGGMGGGMGGGAGSSGGGYEDRFEEDFDPFDEFDGEDPMADHMRQQFADARKARRQHEGARAKEAMGQELKRRQEAAAAIKEQEATQAAAASGEATERLRAAMGAGVLEELRLALDSCDGLKVDRTLVAEARRMRDGLKKSAKKSLKGAAADDSAPVFAARAA